MGCSQLVALTKKSRFSAVLSGTANTVKAIEIPGVKHAGTNKEDQSGKAKAYRIMFLNNEVPVRGRAGLCSAMQAATLDGTQISDTDDTIGDVFSNLDDPQPIPDSMTHLCVASNTASARVIVVWLYAKS